MINVTDALEAAFEEALKGSGAAVQVVLRQNGIWQISGSREHVRKAIEVATSCGDFSTLRTEKGGPGLDELYAYLAS